MKHFIATCLFSVAACLCMAQNAKLPANVNLKTLDGGAVTSAALENGDKPCIISFWATWCHPCNRELAAIKEVYEDWQDETGVKLIAISVDDARSAGKVRPHVEGHDWPYEVYIDENQDLKRAMNVVNIPHVFIVKNGEIVWQHTGYTPGSEEEIIEEVRRLSQQ
ncbi:MAG: thiol-disulfide isomerase-like thioredoxin [bacterium P3]|nr:MAG: thiol-disulfide isomerase-like thioredoxin [bacterium P3]KWW39056.1 MAG: thiol-disulfide isomerase-like thioredoxin [bacterium F083]